jgi:tight adherence protein B
MTRIRRVGVTLAATLLAGAVFTGPSLAAESLRVDAVDQSAHPVVTMTVTAPTQLAGVDLSGADFALAENGTPRQLEVERVAADELELVVLIDTSGSMSGNPMTAARQAASEFMRQLPADASIAVVNFGSEATVTSPFGAPLDAHVAAVAGLQARGETALYDAILTATGQFEGAPNGAKRSIVLLSDGGDTVSSSSLSAAQEALQTAGTSLYAIELRTAETDPKALQALAQAVDGEVVAADTAGALTGVYDQIASSLTSQYTLTYQSEAHGPTELHILAEQQGVLAEATHIAEFPAAPAAPAAPAPPVEAPAPAPARNPITTLVQPGWLASQWALLGGAAAFYLALAAAILLLLSPKRPKTRLAETIGSGGSRLSERTAFAGIADRATEAAERALQRRTWGAGLNAALERANVALRPGEFVVLALSIAVTAGATGYLLGGLLLGLVFALLTPLAARMFLKIKASRRQARFGDQLNDTLQLLAGSLRAGHSMMQAIDAVAQEADAPTSEEFRRLIMETRLGRSMDDALVAMAARLDSEDFTWVVQAISIQRRVGGDLAEVLDTVAKTVRERNQIKRQVKALSAEGRLSAIILMVLPFALLGFMRITNPEYLGELTGNTLGWFMLAFAGLLMTVGAIWLRKIVKIVY